MSERRGSIYGCGAWPFGIVTFLGCRIWCIVKYGFLVGVGLGWLPSAITGAVAGLLWPLLAFSGAVLSYLLLWPTKEPITPYVPVPWDHAAFALLLNGYESPPPERLPLAVETSVIDASDAIKSIDRAVDLVTRNSETLGFRNLVPSFIVEIVDGKHPDRLETRFAVSALTKLDTISIETGSPAESLSDSCQPALTDRAQTCIIKLGLMKENLTHHLEVTALRYSHASAHLSGENVETILNRYRIAR